MPGFESCNSCARGSKSATTVKQENFIAKRSFVETGMSEVDATANTKNKTTIRFEERFKICICFKNNTNLKCTVPLIG